MVISETLQKKLEKFAKRWGFANYEIEQDGELIFWKPTPDRPREVFVVREYELNSKIRNNWERLQEAVDKEGEYASNRS